jgi:hypothetical protein
MRTIVKTALNLGGQTVTEKMALGNHILNGMSNNANFNNPFPPVNVLQQTLNDLAVAIANAIPGNTASTSALHDKEYDLDRTLRMMAAYVEYQSHDDPTTVLSSGFALKQRISRSAPAFTVVHGNLQGGVDLITKAVTGAAYLWQYCPEPMLESGWTATKITNHTTCSYAGLTTGAKYWFRVAVIINDEQQPFSDPVMLVVL